MERLEVSKYQKWYWSIIDKRRETKPKGYSEKHHITPRSFGGSNKKDNIVELTAREHFVCHLLLTKMFPEDQNKTSKMIHAWCWMAWSKSGEREYKVNSHIFEGLRLKRNKIVSERQSLKGNSQYGLIWIYNESLKENTRVNPKSLIPEGWKKGRVLNWDKYFKNKSKPKRRSECKNCKKKLNQKSDRPQKYCSRKCSNSYHYANPQMVIITKDGREKEIRSTDTHWYLKNGWKRIDK